MVAIFKKLRVTVLALAVACSFAPRLQAAEVLKVLAQLTPAATTDTTLYTVPASTSTVVSTITVANTNGVAQTFRIAVRIAGASLTTAQYIAYDTTVGANDTQLLTLGITLGAGDIITVRAGGTGVAFNVFGSELS